MKCPKCQKEMREMNQQGVMVDFCPACKGLWLDGGEINYFVENPNLVTQKLREPLINEKQSEKVCPRCATNMSAGGLFQPGLEIDHCKSCDGLWFDAGELGQLNKISGNKRMPNAEKLKQGAERSARIAAGAAAVASGALPRLPSLALRSVFVLSFLYGLVFVFFFIGVEIAKMPVGIAVLFVILFAALQFLISPIMMDYTLRWFQSMHWVGPAELPPHLNDFITGQVKKNEINYPRMGIIEDGNPNAFTYGTTPNNARVIITRGLIDMLEPDELEAVVAHEIGHALHWDMLVMTAAMLVPELLYIFYRVGMRIAGTRTKSSSKKDPRVYFAMMAVVAFVLYIISQYIVLFLSRTREYYADRFSGEATGDPNALAKGLVKIAYGLARDEQPEPEEGKQGALMAGSQSAIKAFGIFNPDSARALAAVALGTRGGTISAENMTGAMQWDLWNPWASWYELNSTHPLPAKRIQALGALSKVFGKEPLVNFNMEKPESYWDDFLLDLGVYLLPFILPLIFAGPYLFVSFQAGTVPPLVFPLALASLGLGFFIRVLYSYRGGEFPPYRVSGLIKNVKVSGIRPVPTTLKGKVIGKGVPGLIWSEDLVLQDPTGFIFLDYRQPLRIIELLFGLFRVPNLVGQEVIVKGWYRRCPMPFLEMKELLVGGKKYTCYVYHIKVFFSILLMIFGAAWAFYS
jgi:Zn-dependent protease with chaperone function